MRWPIREGILSLCLIVLLTACASSQKVSVKPSGKLQTMQPRNTLMDPNVVIDSIISKLSLDQKIGQLQMVEFYTPKDGSYQVDEYIHSEMDGMIKNGFPGGVLIYNNDAQSMERNQAIQAYKKLSADIQANTALPMLISLDEEGQIVDRLSYIYKDSAAAVRTMAATGNPQVAYNEAVNDSRN
jgi:hypothetical protein